MFLGMHSTRDFRILTFVPSAGKLLPSVLYISLLLLLELLPWKGSGIRVTVRVSRKIIFFFGSLYCAKFAPRTDK